MEIKTGDTVHVRGMTATVLQVQGDRILVEAMRADGYFVNIWVNRSEIR